MEVIETAWSRRTILQFEQDNAGEAFLLWGVPVDKSESMFKVLLSTVEGILKCNAKEAMEICHKRIVAAHKVSQDEQILRNVDAAIQLLTCVTMRLS